MAMVKRPHALMKHASKKRDRLMKKIFKKCGTGGPDTIEAAHAFRRE
jgi:hypothetical protein